MSAKVTDKKSDILLEAGTNELEIVEFSLGNSLYGMNIAKVREIIKSDISIVPVPDSHSSIEGAINLRGKIIPVVNLGRHLNEDIKLDKRISRIIISEFNRIIVGFLVSSVAKIHRISWRQVEKPSDMLQTEQGYAVGIVKIKDKVLFILDFEKIAAHINPRANIQSPETMKFKAQEISFNRAAKVVLVAEDSDFTRNMIIDYLGEAGYRVISTTNGEEAWAQIAKSIDSPNFQKIDDTINLVITDIEMPQMDGLHLIKKIKENSKTRKLPCIAFSSMISPELSAKCKSIGSDGEISKPEIEKLVSVVDNKVL